MNAVKAPLRKKQTQTPQNPGDRLETKTVREWAEIVKEREDERQKRYKADDRVLAYQEENWKLHLELLRKRLGSFFFGAAFGCLVSYLLFLL